MAKDRDDDRKRHRSHRKRDKDDRRRKSSRNDENEDCKKLTSEERLYETAKAYVQRQRSQDKDERDDKREKKSRSKSDKSKDRKRNRKDDHRETKKSKHRHDKDDRKRHKHQSIDIDTSKLISLGPITGKTPNEQLDSSLNYFSHNPHLRLYLYRTHGLYFEDLSSDSTRKYFAEFVSKYNSGALEEAYYQPQLPQEIIDQCSRTKHQWKFRTNEMENEKLNLVKEGVKKQTEYDNSAKKPVDKPVTRHATAAPPKSDKDEYDREQSHLEKRSAQKLSDKRYRERMELANEEIYGVSGGKPSSMRERQQMKKREQANKTHGAHRDREDTMGGQDLDDDAIYGSGEITGGGRRGRELGFSEAVSKERARREKRQAEMAQKVEEGKRKEEEKRKEMLSMLGLSGVDAGKKITIAPRRDG